MAACRAQTLIPRARLEASLGQLSLPTDKQVTVTEATLPRRVTDWTDDTEAPAGAVERGPLAEVTAGVTDDEHLQPGHKFTGKPWGQLCLAAEKTSTPSR